MSTKKDRGYVRVSTLKDSQKDSPEHQESFIRRHANMMGMELDNVYMDKGTATSIMEREDVLQLIEDAKKGEIRTIFFPSLSRFSRDQVDAVTLKRILVNALKIRLISIEDGYDSAIKDDELMFGIRSAVNQESSSGTSVASRRGIRESAEKGNYIGSIPPYGYKKVMDGKRKTLEVIPEQAEIIKLIFDLYINQSMGEKMIVNYLNGDNGNREPIPSYKGGSWGITSIQRILQNEIYTGYNVYGRHTVETKYNDLKNIMDRGKVLVQKPKSEWKRSENPTHPEIISSDMFEKAQDVRLIRGGGVRGGNRAYVNVFAKLIFCEECGSAMVTMASKTANSKGKEYRYLMCSRRRRIGESGCSNSKWLPYIELRGDLIKSILDEVRDRMAKYRADIDDYGFNSEINDHEKESKKLEKKIEDNRKLLFEIRRQNMNGEVDNDQYNYERNIYEKEIDESTKRLSVVAAKQRQRLEASAIHEQMKSALDAFSALESYDDVEKTRLLLSRMVKRIEVNSEGRVRLTTEL